MKIDDILLYKRRRVENVDCENGTGDECRGDIKL